MLGRGNGWCAEDQCHVKSLAGRGHLQMGEDWCQLFLLICKRIPYLYKMVESVSTWNPCGQWDTVLLLWMFVLVHIYTYIQNYAALLRRYWILYPNLTKSSAAAKGSKRFFSAVYKPLWCSSLTHLIFWILWVHINVMWVIFIYQNFPFQSVSQWLHFHAFRNENEPLFLRYVLPFFLTLALLLMTNTRWVLSG